MKRITIGVLSVLLFPVFTSAVWAQSTAQISGTIKDQSGAILPGVDVAATQTATGAKRTAVTNETGSYVLANLPIGPYMLEVSLPGFRTYVQTGIVLQVNTNPVINVTLEIGQVSEQVEVEANAALVETRSTGVGQVIDNQRVLELPLNGRQATELIFLAGMATPGAGATSTTTRNYPTIQVSVAGGLSTGIAYSLDGGPHNDPYNGLNLPLPFPDALQEFKVETSALPAQYGHYSSAAVNAVTKSGTNDFHGSVFEFVRNKALNARSSFAVERDPLKRNQFGGTIGGPIIRNKMFFFGAIQATTQRSNPLESRGYVPTAAMMAGDFTAITSGACTSNGQPITLNAPFAGNRISPASFSPAAVKLQKLLPATDNPCGEIRYSSNFGLVYNEQVVPTRIDYQLNDKHSMFGRYQLAHRVQPSDYDGKNALTVNSGGSPLLVQSFVLGDTYLVGPGTVSSFRGTVNRTRIKKLPQDFPDLNELGVKAFLYHPRYIRVSVSAPGFNVGSNNGTYSHYNTTTYAFAEDISMIRGAHQLGFGANFEHEQLNALTTVRSTAPVAFNGQVTRLPLADFLLGKPSSFSQAADGLFYYRLNYLAAYLQDSWKATQRLTVNAGIRWEPYLPVYVDDIGLSYFDRSGFDQGIKSTVFVNAPAGLKFPGDPGVPGNRRVGHHHLGDLAPRLGIAWDPTGTGSMSIRAAYGIFYNRPNLTTYGGYSSAAPNGSQVSLNFPSSLDDPWKDYPGGDPFPVRVTKDFVFPTQGNYFPFELDAKSTYQNQWNLSLQKQIGSNWLVSGTYIGSSIIHLWTLNKSNPGVFLGLPQSTNANLNQRRILYLANPKEGQYYGDMQSGESGGTGNYHGMLLSVEHRQANGLTMRTNYTWSHCIADLVATSQTASAVMKPFDRSSSRGNCDNSDRRHVFNTSTVYETPRFANNTLRKLAGGWQVSGIVRIMSGSYFDVVAGTDRALTGAPNQRGVQLLTDPYMANKKDLWSNNNLYLNPAAFALPASGTYGNMGANAIRGPGSIRIDMGLSRTFQMRERQSLQFRVEAFNLPNHLNPSNPVSSLNNTTNFGKILNSDDPRIMQAALKYVF